MKKKTLFSLSYLGIALAFFAAGFFTHALPYFQQEKNPFHIERLYPKGGHLTNPIMQVEGPPGGEANLETAIEKIRLFVNRSLKNENAARISVYLRNLDKGRWAGVNEEEKFTAASLAKVPILYTFFIKAQQDPKILEKRILYEKEIASSTQQNILPAAPLQIGNTYTVEELIHSMITNSDNAAMLLLGSDHDIDKALIDQLFIDLRLPIPQKNAEYEISAKDYARYFRLLYSATYLNKDSSEKALKMLTETNFRGGIVAGVPEGTVVAHKFGERGEGVEGQQLHDCGIIYADPSPYLLCIMTQGWKIETLQNIIQTISKTAYEEMTRPQ